MRAVHKVKKFRRTKIFFNNNTETEYKSFGTYLCLLFHVVTFDIKTRVPWHQFLFTLFIPCGRLVIQAGHDSILQILITFEAFTSNALHFWKQEKSGARSGLYVGCSKMSQWNCSSSQACVCRAVCGRALPCNRNIPRESLPNRQDNLRSHRSEENE